MFSKKCFGSRFSSIYFSLYSAGDSEFNACPVFSQITEMAKESLPCLTKFVYPALAGCKAPVDVILPQITSNIW